MLQLQWFPLLFTHSNFCIITEPATPLAEAQTSRRPRFSTPARSKRNTGKRCPKNVFLPGVTSLKGENCYCIEHSVCLRKCLICTVLKGKMVLLRRSLRSHVNIKESPSSFYMLLTKTALHRFGRHLFPGRHWTEFTWINVPQPE